MVKAVVTGKVSTKYWKSSQILRVKTTMLNTVWPLWAVIRRFEKLIFSTKLDGSRTACSKSPCNLKERSGKLRSIILLDKVLKPIRMILVGTGETFAWPTGLSFRSYVSTESFRYVPAERFQRQSHLVRVPQTYGGQRQVFTRNSYLYRCRRCVFNQDF